MCYKTNFDGVKERARWQGSRTNRGASSSPNEDAELVLSHTKDKISINVLRGFPTDAWAVLDVSVLSTKEPIEKVLQSYQIRSDAECKTRSREQIRRQDTVLET